MWNVNGCVCQVNVRPFPHTVDPSQSRVPSASIWRSHLVVRQWLRLASRRRLNVTIRLLMSVLLVENVAGDSALTADPWWKIRHSAPSRHPDYNAPHSDVLRFFAISTAYLLVGL